MKRHHVSLVTRSLLLACAFTACGGDAPIAGIDDDPGSGNIQRTSLTVTASVDPRDGPVADALGWNDGRIPGATVVIRRIGDARADSAFTSDAGEAVFENLLEGSYTVATTRLLTVEERGRLPADMNDVLVLGGGGPLVPLIPPAAGAVSVSAVAGRRGTLAISEVHATWIITPGVGSYSFSRFVEIYNNGEGTVYLDGMLFGAGFAHSVDAGLYPCSESLDFLEDPEGIWTTYLFRFPGSGRSHPIRPGEVRVIAIDAIDHTEFAPEALDLSGADFELIGNGDVDNPAVPNLTSVGPSYDRPGGHGDVIYGNNNVLYLSNPLDLSTLPRQVRENPRRVEYVRVPKDGLLDVMSMALVSGGIQFCQQLVHTTIDQQTHTFIDFHHTRSFQRPLLATLPDGQKLLQRTRTSARDFTQRGLSPGSLP